jgi:broad specificity phosphatase PhoE
LECFNSLSKKQDLSKFNLISSPLKRAQETSLHFKKNLNKQLSLNEAFREIPSPGISLLERKNWLQEVFKKNINDLEIPQQNWKSNIISTLKDLSEPTIIFSHFMVINIVVNTLKEDLRMVSFYPDNCSVTELKSDKGELNLISTGNELQTHIN